MKMSPSSLKPFCFIVFILLFYNCNPVFAGTRTWTGGAGENKNWSFAGNWGGTVPASGDDIIFNTPGIISFSSPTLPPDLSFFNSFSISQGTITLSGGDITRFFILGGNTGTDFIISNGATLTIDRGLSIYLGQSASANIDGILNTGINSKYNTDQPSSLTTVNGTIKAALLGSLICTDASRLVFNSGAYYIHNKPNGVIPAATWAPASNCRIFTGAGQSLTITGFSQSFGNLLFQTGQSDFFYIDASLNILGDLSVITTGSGAISIRSNAGPRTISVGGNYTQTGGYFKLNSGTGGTTMSVAGNFTMSGLTRTFSFGEGTTNSFVNVAGNTTVSNGTLILSNGENSGTFSVAGNLTQSGGSITELGTGTGEMILNGNTPQVYNPSGGLLQNMINFTINNTNGVTLTGSVIFAGSLNLVNGILTVSPGYTLLLTKGEPINSAGFSNNRHIATQVNNSTGVMGFLEIHNIARLIPFIFPVGDGTNYLPLTISSEKGKQMNKFKLCVFNGVTQNGLPDGIPFTMLEKQSCVNAVWNLQLKSQQQIMNPLKASITFGWPDVLEGPAFSTANIGLIGIAKSELAVWGLFEGTGNNNTNTATRTNLTTFSSFFTGLRIPVPL